MTLIMTLLWLMYHNDISCHHSIWKVKIYIEPGQTKEIQSNKEKQNKIKSTVGVIKHDINKHTMTLQIF